MSAPFLLARLFAVSLGALPLVMPTVAVAQPAPAAQTETVKVEVALVRASRGPASVDPSLQGMARDLAALPYTRFERTASGGWSTKVGQPGQAALGDLKVTATVTSATPDAVGVTVEVFRAGARIAHTSFQRPWGRAHVLSVGTEGEAAIVLPVRVTH